MRTMAMNTLTHHGDDRFKDKEMISSNSSNRIPDSSILLEIHPKFNEIREFPMLM